MSTIADVKVAHNYNCYNGYLFGCLLIFMFLQDYFSQYGGTGQIFIDFPLNNIPLMFVYSLYEIKSRKLFILSL